MNVLYAVSGAIFECAPEQIHEFLCTLPGQKPDQFIDESERIHVQGTCRVSTPGQGGGHARKQ